MTEHATTASGDRILCLAASPTFADDRLCFMGRVTGLYRSADGGTTWRPTGPANNRSLAITAVCVSPQFPTDRRIVAGVPGGILRSDNAGATWRDMTLAAPPPVTTDIAWSTDGTILAATMEDGIFRSPDAGVTWGPANAGLLDYSVLALALSPGFDRDGTAVAGTGSGLYVSQTRGQAWTARDLPGHDGAIEHLATHSAADGSCAIVAIGAGGNAYRSTDAGRRWERVPRPLPDRDVIAAYWRPGTTPEHQAAGTLVVVGAHSVVISGDMGETWQRPAALDLPTQPIVAATMASHSTDGMCILAGLADGTVQALQW